MLASIIITTFKRPVFLERAILSCINQDVDGNYEIIVVDDNGIGSKSQLETQQLVSLFSEVVYTPLEKNSGACIARNKGVEKARGSFLFFLDDDDEFLISKLRVQILIMEESPNLDGCLAGFIRRENDTQQNIVAPSNFPVVGDLVNFAILGNFFTPMLCVRREAFLKTGGFDDIPRFQDRFWMIKALEHQMNFVCLNKPLHIMYEHGDHRITASSIDKSLQSLDTIKEKLLSNKSKFTNEEWKLFLIKDFRMRGVIFYTAKFYSKRLKSISYFYKSFILTKSFSDIEKILKAILKT